MTEHLKCHGCGQDIGLIGGDDWWVMGHPYCTDCADTCDMCGENHTYDHLNPVYREVEPHGVVRYACETCKEEVEQ